MAVATALCADQAVMAAPAARPQAAAIGQIASRLVGRLAQGLRRGMPAAVQQPRRQVRLAAPAPARSSVAQALPIAHTPISPFQFRLPPPAR
ncbi:MAG TPA: hypothetical protein VFC78_11435 [Tepidisphaeraceae bacterium]|nr:hypothetical protein [Tepidisphaeraceae bacterium]